eukprot:1138272-Pelagomonas_calceolata.AAC.9
MGRETLGLLASNQVHTWLLWPAQRPPCPETLHAGQAITEQKMASTARPAHPPPWNSACRPTEQKMASMACLAHPPP